MIESQEIHRKKQVLKLRQDALRAIRGFLTAAGFLEVETPVRIPAPALEDYIDAEPSGAGFLRTSPELHMKRLLACGCEQIFQIGPCFRQGERGRYHLPEFTMLEWYRTDADENEILSDLVSLVRTVAGDVLGKQSMRFQGETIALDCPWEEITVEDAFRKYASADVEEAVAAGRFDELLVEKIEPELGHGRPTVLREYPRTETGLSRPLDHRPDRTARWELYIAGIELANACAEITDPELQRQNFLRTAELRKQEGRQVYPMDEEFLAALEHGLPPCAGIAVGIDRFIMLLADAQSVADVVAFA